MNLPFGPSPLLIGMVHLKALPGAPRYAGSMADILDAALADAQALQSGGMDAILVENFFDAPFFVGSVPPETVAAIAAIVSRIVQEVGIPVGVNVLRNDVFSAIAIAAATGAKFVRCNVYVGAAVTDQGLIEGRAAEATRTRVRLSASVDILADVHVKHAIQLSYRPIGDEATDAVERGLADAIIVSGPATGSATPVDRLQEVREALPRVPLLVGSGFSLETARALLAVAEGAIVGSSLKVDGVVSNPVDPGRVRRLVEACRTSQT